MKLAICLLLAVCAACYGAPVGVDGQLGSEWDGTAPSYVFYHPNAPMHNFQAPDIVNHNVAYNIWFRGDMEFVYGLLISEGDPGAMPFANAYLDTNRSTGADIVFEVTNTDIVRLSHG